MSLAKQKNMKSICWNSLQYVPNILIAQCSDKTCGIACGDSGM